MRQGNLSPVEDCPGGQRNLVPAEPAHCRRVRADQFVGLPVSASRANETIGPATGSQILLAGFLSSEVRLSLTERFGKRRTRHAYT